MHIAVFTSCAASRKEPLADPAARIRSAFLAQGFAEPAIGFTMSDGAVGPLAEALGGKSVSGVDRVLKRFPEMEMFLRPRERKRLTNRAPETPADNASFETLLRIAAGVPRSFPYHFATDFGKALGTALNADEALSIGRDDVAGIVPALLRRLPHPRDGIQPLLDTGQESAHRTAAAVHGGVHRQCRGGFGRIASADAE